VQFGIVSLEEGRLPQKAAAQTALELDSTLAEAHYALAAIRTWDEWDWEGGETAFRRAIQLKPNDPLVRALYSHLLMIRERPDEAMAQIEHATELDPLNEYVQVLYGVDLYMARRFDEAIEQFQRALKTAPNNPLALWGLHNTFHALERYEEALESLEAAYAARDDGEVQQVLVLGYADGGYRGAMRRAAETLATRSRTAFVSPVDVAYFFVKAEQRDLAFEWLEIAYEAHNPNLPYIGAIPLFDIVRDDPRFQDLLRRMNLPQ